MMFRRTLKGLNLLIVIITVCMRTGMHELWAGCGGQRSSFWSRFYEFQGSNSRCQAVLQAVSPLSISGSCTPGSNREQQEVGICEISLAKPWSH